MTLEYTFERREVDGSSRIVADPVSGDANAVELASTWGTDQDVEGKWEDAVHAVLDAALFDSGTVGDDMVRVDRSTAVDALVESLDDVRDEPQADALVAYLASASVWKLDGDDVVVLQDPREGSLSGREMLTWAAAVDVCIERVDTVRETLEQSDADSLKRANADSMLVSVRDALSMKGSELRVRALHRRSFPDDATMLVVGFEDLVGILRSDDPVEAVEASADFAWELAGGGHVDATVENTSDEEFEEMVDDAVVEMDVEPSQEETEEGENRVD